MSKNFYRALLLCAMLSSSNAATPQSPVLRYKARSNAPETLALYEAWFGFYKHMDVGYSGHDPQILRMQMQKAKSLGIAGFVVDWFGDRNPFVDQTYALMQKIAPDNNFKIAIMYDQANSDGSTDSVIAELTKFHDTYLAPTAPGRSAYLSFEGRPVIFVFPYRGNTDWIEVRSVIDRWNPAPLLIRENRPGADAQAFDGFYPWPNPGSQGWTADGSNWGEKYLEDFYKTMATKYPDKMTVAGAWPQFDDSKAKWGKNRHMSARCGQTYADTVAMWRRYYAADQVIPYLLIETWNDYEEGTQIEAGLPNCSPGASTR